MGKTRVISKRDTHVVTGDRLRIYWTGLGVGARLLKLKAFYLPIPTLF
jgi:hypothetical protein